MCIADPLNSLPSAHDRRLSATAHGQLWPFCAAISPMPTSCAFRDRARISGRPTDHLNVAFTSPSPTPLHPLVDARAGRAQRRPLSRRPTPSAAGTPGGIPSKCHISANGGPAFRLASAYVLNIPSRIVCSVPPATSSSLRRHHRRNLVPPVALDLPDVTSHSCNFPALIPGGSGWDVTAWSATPRTNFEVLATPSAARLIFGTGGPADLGVRFHAILEGSCGRIAVTERAIWIEFNSAALDEARCFLIPRAELVEYLVWARWWVKASLFAGLATLASAHPPPARSDAEVVSAPVRPAIANRHSSRCRLFVPASPAGIAMLPRCARATRARRISCAANQRRPAASSSREARRELPDRC